MKKVFLILIFGVFLLLLFGCNSRTRRRPAANRENSEEILVFHDNNSLLISQFQKAHPEIDIQVVNMSSSPAGDKYENCVNQYGYPDIILLNDKTAGLNYYYENDRIASLDEYISFDSKIDETLYCHGVFEAGKIEGEQYGLTLTIEIPYMTIREDLWVESAFAEMPENYTGNDLLTAMNIELDKAEEREDYRVFPYINDTWRMPDWFYVLGIMNTEDEEFEIDEELFKKLYDMCIKDQENKILSESYFENFVNGGFGAAGGDVYLAVGYGTFSSPQIGLVLDQSLNQDKYQDEIKVIWYPTADNSDIFKVQVDTIGAIGQESTKKSEAYEILRLMMDMPYSSALISNDVNIAEKTPCPVNIMRAMELLDFVEKEGPTQLVDHGTSGYITNYDVEKQPVSEEVREQFEYVLENAVVYRKNNNELETDIRFIASEYIQDCEEDYYFCYIDLVRRCN